MAESSGDDNPWSKAEGAEESDHDGDIVAQEVAAGADAGGSSGLAQRRARDAARKRLQRNRPLQEALAEQPVHRASRAALEGCMASAVPQAGRLVYVEAYRADETPLRVRTSSLVAASDVQVGAATRGEIVAQGLGPEVCHLLFPAGRSADDSTVPRKPLQSQQQFGILVERPGGGCISIVGQTATWLQYLDRCTAECLVEAMRAGGDPGGRRVQHEGETRDRGPGFVQRACRAACRLAAGGLASLASSL